MTSISLCPEYRAWLQDRRAWRVLDSDLTALEAIDWIAWGAAETTENERSPEVWDEADRKFVHALAGEQLTARGLKNGAGYPKKIPAKFWNAWPALEPLESTATVRRRIHKCDSVLVEDYWTQIRVAVQDVLALWPVALSAEHQRIAPTENVEPHGSIHEWYKHWVSACNNTGLIPTREDDWAAVKETFGLPRVNRNLVRTARQHHAPEHWRKSGPKSLRRKCSDNDEMVRTTTKKVRESWRPE
jgi:hypothetical protein